ncbi:MAG TPA: sulfite exporter TauE/SafE family protein [Gaiellaceae bacterium]|nr:sulfite exporter TauE/SafE family protein [Gaiellaceae bacterium]
MRRLALLACLAALAAPSGAAAHPLGNFTVNRLAAVDLAGDRIYVRYVLDLAEIPTYQERKHVERAGYARGVARKLELRLDGRAARLDVVRFRFGLKRGAGGLETLRFEAVFRARATGSRLELRDRNYANRLGWREIVVRARDGARLVAASVPDRSASDDLRSYPGELLDVRHATASFDLGTRPGEPPALGPPGPAEPAGGFEALIAEPGTMVLALVLAAFWGAAHALTPGHGKAIVAGYLVGSRGKPQHAVALGLIVTVTHTIGVFALGVVTLALSAVVVPEQLYPWLTLVSGVLVVVVGASVLRRRLRPKRAEHHHQHEQDLRGLLGVGVAAGLLPCPSALVVLLSAIALHRIGLGLALIVAFSAGLAATITTIGLVAVLAQRAFARLRLDGRLVGALPAVSAALILVVGAGLTINALPEVL